MDDDLWVLIQPHLPRGSGAVAGPRPVPDRLCLQGIPFALYNDIAWQLLPLELGFGSGQTWWRRLDRWAGGGGLRPAAPGPALGAQRGRRTRLVPGLRGRLPHPGENGGADTGPSSVDWGQTGSKHHLICDGRGTPLKVITTAANVNDVTQTLALVDGIPPVAGRPGRPRRPEALLATRATTPTLTGTRSASAGSCLTSRARDHPTSRASVSVIRYLDGCLKGVWWTPIRTMPTIRSICRSSGKAASALTVEVMMSGRTK
ncbi:transposase [Streptomyces anulatus]|uniref:transposase n=1 Tax=Streptomyces anulatus TaxID=1892 RepID=UPI00369B74A6